MKVLSPSQTSFSADMLDNKLKTLCLTAPHAQAGTTTCTAALANELSRSFSKSVVVIDGCSGESSLTHQAHLQDRKGFFDYISAPDGEIFQCIYPFNDESFQIIPSGDSEKISRFNVDSKCVAAEVIEVLRQKFDCILYDAPFVYSKNNSLALSSLFDGTLLIINNNDTRREVASSAVKRLAGMNAKIEGIIYNRRRYHVPHWLYRLF